MLSKVLTVRRFEVRTRKNTQHCDNKPHSNPPRSLPQRTYRDYDELPLETQTPNNDNLNRFVNLRRVVGHAVDDGENNNHDADKDKPAHRAIRQRRFKKGELALAKHPDSRKWVAVKVLEAQSSGRYEGSTPVQALNDLLLQSPCEIRSAGVFAQCFRGGAGAGDNHV